MELCRARRIGRDRGQGRTRGRPNIVAEDRQPAVFTVSARGRRLRREAIAPEPLHATVVVPAT
jgi:hypothetical protein